MVKINMNCFYNCFQQYKFSKNLLKVLNHETRRTNDELYSLLSHVNTILKNFLTFLESYYFMKNVKYGLSSGPYFPLKGNTGIDSEIWENKDQKNLFSWSKQNLLTKRYYKVWQVLYGVACIIKCGRYYKKWQVL